MISRSTAKYFILIASTKPFNRDVFDLIWMHFIIYAVENLIIGRKFWMAMLHADIDSI